ncbi:MAG: hypothetical protein R3C49_20275 [Planctomycetaceae bacterium]
MRLPLLFSVVFAPSLSSLAFADENLAQVPVPVPEPAVAISGDGNSEAAANSGPVAVETPPPASDEVPNAVEVPVPPAPPAEEIPSKPIAQAAVDPEVVPPAPPAPVTVAPDAVSGSASPVTPPATQPPADSSKAVAPAAEASPNSSGLKNQGLFTVSQQFTEPATIPQPAPVGTFSPTLGARFQAQTFQLAAFGEFPGVRITSVPVAGSPLHQAGLTQGDILTRLDGARILNLQELEIHARDTAVRFLKQDSEEVSNAVINIDEFRYFTEAGEITTSGPHMVTGLPGSGISVGTVPSYGRCGQAGHRGY